MNPNKYVQVPRRILMDLLESSESASTPLGTYNKVMRRRKAETAIQQILAGEYVEEE